MPYMYKEVLFIYEASDLLPNLFVLCGIEHLDAETPVHEFLRARVCDNHLPSLTCMCDRKAYISSHLKLIATIYYM